ncbi:YoaK family protein [Gordonia hydrophobica]|uniref:YoaK family protein n=1 Tax=Gordonia hydrophobica TaxID=40516 RepID=A0ABZ2TXP7_9ACTN|nr:YoaK family protein [Gordonia hydrophobica]MBM7366326.1 uncharacterized membrane protein YoaK (UPF0700 family) [Gordonia hydrophobica]
MRSALRREVGLAVVLASVAGYLDAVGFLVLGGRFVSFMSGNTTEFATFLGTGDLAGVGTVAVLLAMFFLGVMGGAVAARFGDPRTTVLVVTIVLLAITAVATSIVDPDLAVMVGMPAAMGTINATFLKQGEVTIGLTYMTGALVKSGQQLVDAFAGGPRWLWLRNLGLWMALAVGGVLGAFTHRLTGVTAATWIAVGVISVVTVVVVVVRKRAGRFGSQHHHYRETTVIGNPDEPEPIS